MHHIDFCHENEKKSRIPSPGRKTWSFETGLLTQVRIKILHAAAGR